MRKEIDRILGSSLRCILPSYWWKRLLGKMADKIESAESSASSAMKVAILAGLEASDKQERLVSGSNIKTICGNSILGSGNITPDPSMKVYIPMGGTLSSYSKSDNQSFYRRVRDGGNWVNSWRAIAVTASANKEVVLLGVSYNTTQGCRILISGFQEADITDKYECVLLEDGSVSSVTKVEGESGGSSITVDSEVSETSENPVQNKAIKAYVDEKVANAGGGSSVDVDTELSTSSTNPVQNKVITNAINAKADNTRVDLISERLDDIDSEMKDFATESQLNNKQDVITDLDTIRQGAAKGATALQSIPSEYITESELTSKGYATTSQLNNKQDVISDLATIRSNASKGATALQSVPSEYVTETELSSKNFATVSQVNAKQDTISDLATIRSNAAKGATAIQQVKTINGEAIVGEGNIDVLTKDLYDNILEEMLVNEEVYAAGVNDLNSRLLETNDALNSEVASREELSEEVQALTDRVTSNEEVTATSYNELNSRIESNYQHGEEAYATKTELADEVSTINAAIVDNEEVIAATLNDLLSRIKSLTTRIEQLENA